jgi:hypothetical protein
MPLGVYCPRRYERIYVNLREHIEQHLERDSINDTPFVSLDLLSRFRLAVSKYCHAVKYKASSGGNGNGNEEMLEEGSIVSDTIDTLLLRDEAYSMLKSLVTRYICYLTDPAASNRQKATDGLGESICQKVRHWQHSLCVYHRNVCG